MLLCPAWGWATAQRPSCRRHRRGTEGAEPDGFPPRHRRLPSPSVPNPKSVTKFGGVSTTLAALLLLGIAPTIPRRRALPASPNRPRLWQRTSDPGHLASPEWLPQRRRLLGIGSAPCYGRGALAGRGDLARFRRTELPSENKEPRAPRLSPAVPPVDRAAGNRRSDRLPAVGMADKRPARHALRGAIRRDRRRRARGRDELRYGRPSPRAPGGRRWARR